MRERPRIGHSVEQWSSFYARQHICYSAYMLSPVRPSVCHTGGSYKDGWS